MKSTIIREQAIPFRDSGWDILQMVEHRITVSVTQDELESEESLETRLDTIFKREFEKALSTDSVYQKQQKQLKILVDFIKKETPSKYNKVILELKKI